MMEEICKSRTIIFDFDGVIADSEKVYHEKWNEAARDNGYHLTEEELLSLRSCDKSIASLLFGGTKNYDKVRQRRRELMNACLSLHPFEMKKGIKETFAWLHDHDYKIIIASSSELSMITKHLDVFGISDYITEVLSVKSLKRGKPYPDIYEYICDNYHLNPEDTLAIEDSPNGIRSAYGAHVPVIMIPDLTPPTEEDRSMIVTSVNGAEELIKLLK